jgi:3-hydroxyacyl-[acyl-carrier-protein] dehydratase
VAAKKRIIDPSEYDLSKVISDKEAIRKINPQRHEMEQLDAVVFEDIERKICVGYKDITTDEFWARGHFPGMPVMPGVIMCEAAAQLSAYFTSKFDLLGAEVVGLGGMEEVRVREPVIPPARLVLAVQQIRLRRGAVIVCYFQGVVGDRLAVEGKIKGVPLPSESLRSAN